MVSNFKPKPSKDLEHRRLIRPAGDVDGAVKHHRDADHRSQEAEDRDRPNDDAEQAVTGVEPGGIHVGKVLQLVVQRLGRAAMANVLQSGPQPADVILVLPPAGQTVEPRQQGVALLDRLRRRFGVGQQRVVQPGALPHHVQRLDQQRRQTDGEHHRQHVLHRMMGEVSFDKWNAQRACVDQGVEPYRAKHAP